MVSEVEVTNRMMLRARDAMDRNSEKDLVLATLAGIAGASRAHFVRTSRRRSGKHRIGICSGRARRRVERAMYLLRNTELSVTEVCMQVGFTSLGTFRTFTDIVGEPPSKYRTRGPLPFVPSCFVKAWTRPSTFGEANR